MTKRPAKKLKVKHAGSPSHLQDVIRKCVKCRQRFHPRRNGYSASQQYCDAACAKSARRFGSTSFSSENFLPL